MPGIKAKQKTNKTMKRNVLFTVVIIGLCLCGCRSSHQTVKDTAQRTDYTVTTDTGHQERVTTDDGRQQSEQFNSEWEDLELVQVHERDTAGNERTVTTVKGHRRKEGASRQQREQHREVCEDSTAAHHEASDMQEKSNKEAVKTKEPAPVADTPGFWRICWVVLFIVMFVAVIIWPESVRKVGCWVIGVVKNTLKAWLRQ